MTPSKGCFDIIKQQEGLRLKAYIDQTGTPTIGFGNTFYPDGAPVKMGEVISKETADRMLEYTVNLFSKGVVVYVKSHINQNQLDSLVCFAYNVGLGAFKSSTLLKKVNANPNDPAIRDEFNKWTKSKGVQLKALVNRRKAEADLYFKP